MSTEENRKNINKNRRALFEAEAAVMYNRGQAYVTRSIVMENQNLISKNYNAAFMGNRQLANQNTDDLFRNRLAAIRNIDVSGGQVAENYREALTNKTKLEYLEHRSKLNVGFFSPATCSFSLQKRTRAINDKNRRKC